MLQNLAMGFSVALTPTNLLFCFTGTLIGTLVGVLPGVGPAATLAMLLPITATFSPEAALIMLAGIYYGAQYGGSTTAILLNMPGEASSAVTAIDGYQMARAGRAGAALCIAAVGSFIAGSFATLVIAVLAVPMASIALSFGPAEYFSLLLLGIIGAIALAHGSVLKALAATAIGILLSTIGTDIDSGLPRFNFGTINLADGLDVVAVAVGMFGIAEILRNLEGGSRPAGKTNSIGSLYLTKAEWKMSLMPIARGSLVGTILGVLPGGGALLSSFASYAVEKRLSKDPSRFGRGAIEGVAGPEAANNAGAQTSFIPMLTLGIPANAVMALMIGAMIIQGIAPGPQVLTDRPAMFWGLIASMWIGNAMLVVLNLPLVGIWVKLITIPYAYLAPAIVAFCAIGAYSVSGAEFDVYVVLIFGVAGYFLTKLGFEMTPLLLGFVLGPIIEENFRRALVISGGDPSIFVVRPLSATLLALAVVTLALVSLPRIAIRRSEVFNEQE